MNNNTDILKESKPLSYFINKTNAYIRNPYNKADDDRRKNKFIEEFLPIDLLDDIKYVVEKHYDGNYAEYFKCVDLYFTTFTYQDLVIANTLHGDLYNSPIDSKTKKYLRNKRKSVIYHASVLLKLVGKEGRNYCSNTLFNDFKLNKVKEQEFVRSQTLISADGHVISLAKATRTAEQNLAEKLNIIDTMEKIAKDKDFTWCFVTLTLPPEYHPNPTKGKNSYNGISPKESAKLLNSKFNECRALLKHNNILPARDYFGTATSEAHKDGCLHKHVLVFCSEDMINELKRIFFTVFTNLNDDSFRINDGRAKASSYVFKYVMKSLSNFDNDLDILSITEFNNPLAHATMLNNAFRSYNHIRGVSFFGIENCLSKFRFLARNIKKVDMHARLEVIIKTNDLYAFITERHFDDIDNEYVETSSGNKKFVGCKVFGIRYLKNFFKMGKTKVINGAKEVYKEIASLGEQDILIKLGLFELLVNHNYSRKAEKPEILNYQVGNWENLIEVGMKYQ